MVRDMVVSDDGRGGGRGLPHRLGLPDEGHHHPRVTTAVGALDGVREVTRRPRRDVRRAAQGPAEQLRGGQAEREVPFAQPGSLTRVYAVASGKGGVGKSSVTVNLAAAMAADGLRSAWSTPTSTATRSRACSASSSAPTQVDDMIMPPQSHGVKVISIGMFIAGNPPVVWRGPMLHRALQQFLADVFWGDLDVLLLDLPPGTGDIAISVAQLVPNAEILVVTTPQRRPPRWPSARAPSRCRPTSGSSA